MAYSDFISFIDWDFLKSPLSITKIVDSTYLPQGEKEIVLERDAEYNLKGTLKFQDTKFFPDRQDNIAGKIYDGFDLVASSNDNVTSFKLEHCRLGGFHYPGGNGFFGSSDLRFNELKIKFSEKTPNRLREWYLNGPSYHTSIGSTEGKTLLQCSKERFLSKDKLDSTNNFGICSFSGHYIWGKNSNYKFLIAKVPTDEPNWSTNLQIEYHNEWGKIPEPDERLKIEELCSFVFGKHLLSLGYTAYDRDENIVEVYAHSPWGHSTKYSCVQPEFPPVRIHDYPLGDAEKIINYLLPKYIELSDCLCLKEALWNYWISCDIPTGPNLPIIASALEAIISNWCKWKKIPSSGLYMETAEFKELLHENIESIKKKLETVNNGQKILDNILSANQFYVSLTQKYSVFFDKIKLNVSQAEWEAFAGRHQFVHGLARFNEIDWEQAIIRKNILDTLFNKTLLKILEYKWDYIDRSVEGWPDAQLG